MTQKFINPLTKFTTDTLQSLPYATLSFFVNGSSTTKAVYADKSKATSLGTVVTADSAGNFPPIWLDGTYRATLKSKSANIADNPATGVTQTGWPIDSVGDAQSFTAFSAWDSTFTYDITTNSFVTGSDGNYYQSIQNPNFNKDPISQPAYWTRIYFLPTWNSSVNYAVDVLVIYNGLLYKSNATGINHAPPNLSFWDNVSFNASITGPFTATGAVTGGSLNTAGNLNFSATGERIIGDFSNATLVNRVYFQSITGNAASYIGVIPNGSSSVASFSAYNSQTPTNASVGSITVDSTQVLVESSRSGSGSYLPLNFATSGVNRFVVSVDGRIYGSGIHNNAGSMTGTTNQYIGSGTYTPTLSAPTNCTSALASVCAWSRTGNVITCSFSVSMTITSASSLTQVRFTYPLSCGVTPSTLFGSASTTWGVGNTGGALTAIDSTVGAITFYSPAGSAGSSIAYYGSFTYAIT